MKKKRGAIEGQVYECTWRRRGKLFAMKCLAPVVAESSGCDLERAVEDLRAQIMDIAGDGEAVLQFTPPLPEASEARARFDPEYYYLEYNDMVDWEQSSQELLFSDGICMLCGTGLGHRTGSPRLVTTLPHVDLVGFRKDKNHRFMMSEHLVQQLQPSLGSDVRLIKTVFAPGIQKRLKGKKFYEIDFAPTVEAAVPRAHDGFSKTCSFRCPKCRTQSLIFSAKRLRAQPAMYVVRSRVGGEVLLLGQGSSRVIALDAQLKENLFRDRKLKGIIAERLVMLDNGEALSREELRKIQVPSP